MPENDPLSDLEGHHEADAPRSDTCAKHLRRNAARQLPVPFDPDAIGEDLAHATKAARRIDQQAGVGWDHERAALGLRRADPSGGVLSRRAQDEKAIEDPGQVAIVVIGDEGPSCGGQRQR